MTICFWVWFCMKAFNIEIFCGEEISLKCLRTDSTICYIKMGFFGKRKHSIFFDKWTRRYTQQIALTLLDLKNAVAHFEGFQTTFFVFISFNGAKADKWPFQ